jgi:hypothetical protein
LLTFNKFNRSFESQRDRIDKLYDYRSRFVHAGESLTEIAALEELMDICKQCFRCLLELQLINHNATARSEDTLVRWLQTLDYLSKGLIAGRTISPDEFKAASII